METPSKMDFSTQAVRKAYDRKAKYYDLTTAPMGLVVPAHRRREIFEDLEPGMKLLEIGVGTGKNVSFYPRGVDTTAVDLSERMLDVARKRADRTGRSDVRFEWGDARNLRFPDASFDRIVTCCVFCSVPDPLACLREALRVCKPGGSFVMIEHVRPGNRVLGRLFDLMNGMTIRFMGFNINRRTMETVRLAGFEIEKETNLFLDIVKVAVAVPREEHGITGKDGRE